MTVALTFGFLKVDKPYVCTILPNVNAFLVEKQFITITRSCVLENSDLDSNLSTQQRRVMQSLHTL